MAKKKQLKDKIIFGIIWLWSVILLIIPIYFLFVIYDMFVCLVGDIYARLIMAIIISLVATITIYISIKWDRKK